MTEQRDDFNGSKASTAKISLSGSSEESTREAHAWLADVLCCSSPTRTVQNNFITHFGEEEYQRLTNIMRKNNISVKESLKRGQASLVLTGLSAGVAVAFLEVENMLRQIQEDFVKQELKTLTGFTNTSLNYRRCAVPKAHFSEKAFLNSGLEIVKV